MMARGVALQAVGEAEGSRAIPWRHPVRNWCRLPEMAPAAWAGPERTLAADGRAGWCASAPGWIRHRQARHAGAQ